MLGVVPHGLDSPDEGGQAVDEGGEVLLLEHEQEALVHGHNRGAARLALEEGELAWGT